MTVIALTLTLVSCGGESHLALPANPSPTPANVTQIAPPAAVTPTILEPMVGELTWTTAIDSVTGEPTDAVTRYLTDAPQLIAATKTAALPAGSRLEAAWTYNNTPLEAFATRLSADGSVDERWMSFSLSRDPNTPWPAGLYEIAVTLDGKLAQQSSVEVLDAE